jgi:hypothetical protein
VQCIGRSGTDGTCTPYESGRTLRCSSGFPPRTTLHPAKRAARIRRHHLPALSSCNLLESTSTTVRDCEIEFKVAGGREFRKASKSFSPFYTSYHHSISLPLHTDSFPLDLDPTYFLPATVFLLSVDNPTLIASTLCIFIKTEALSPNQYGGPS